MPIPKIKEVEELLCNKPSGEPNKNCSVITLKNVEIASTEPLVKTVKRFFVYGSDEQTPSAAASNIAASPPHSSIVKKINVSEAVT